MSNMVVRTNILAMNSHRNLGLVSNQQARASRNLSSGFRINSAADDAAGLAISEGMRSQIRGMAQAARNTQDGISMIQTAEGYMNTITELAQRARELVVQGANDTNNDGQRSYLIRELDHIASEMVRIWTTATFNGQAIFSEETLDAGEEALFTREEFILQVGPDGTAGHSFDINPFVEDGIESLTTGAGGVGGDWGTGLDQDYATITFSELFDDFEYAHGDPGQTSEGWNASLQNIDDFLTDVNTLRADLGALQNRLEFTIENLDIARENLSASESRIRDADMALEMMRLTQANVLQQAATAMLAQGNQAPQSILQLLG